MRVKAPGSSTEVDGHGVFLFTRNEKRHSKMVAFFFQTEHTTIARNTMNGDAMMELAKITSKGQITLPIDIRRKLNLHDGGKVAFVEQGGTFMLVNPASLAIAELQDAFEGEAERLGLKTEEDVTKLVKEVRRKRREERNANNG
jgi:AbrB family looped-hinge helix DNA binding protein